MAGAQAGQHQDGGLCMETRPRWPGFDLPNITGCILLISAALWLRYSFRYARFQDYRNSEHAKVAPLTFPYYFPLLGSLPLQYLWRPKDFVLNQKGFFQSAHPVLVKILTYEFYVVRGPENIRALFKNSRLCTSIPFVKFALGYAFGLPRQALRLYDRDDSGGSHVPHPGSTIEAHNRIDYLSFQSMSRFLEGKGLAPFCKRFTENITQQLYSLHDRTAGGTDWTYHADLMETVGDAVTAATLDALCGPHLLRLNPTFLQDFWAFDRNLQTYMQGIPWLFAPKAYMARERVLNAVQVWQQHARENFDSSAVGPDGDDPFWGSSLFRERHDMYLKMDGFDHKAIASEDFGAIWASRNSIATVSWAIFEIYRDPELLAELRAEVDTCMLKGGGGRIRFDVDKLLRQPLLQAVYAETLRLRMHFYIVRMADKVDLNIRDWIIPRQKIIVTLSTVAHMDVTAWDTAANEHPLDQFWIGRFLKNAHGRSSETDTVKQTKEAPAARTFSTEHLEGSWIPYGGGPRQCPGRHFAKRQILLSTALMVSLFDCEILREGKNVQEDCSLMGFGGGVSLPAGKVPMRMRRRNWESRR